MTSLIIMAVAAVVLFGVLALSFRSIVSRYKRCPSDKILVIYGRVAKDETGKATAQTYHGGAAFVWPIIQDHAYLDLKPIAIEIALKNALSKQNIRVDVPSTFTVAVSTNKPITQNAAERLLGLDKQSIIALANDIILGQMRQVISMMDIEEINSDRDKFQQEILKNVEVELNKIGLDLINVNITDIKDESGYIAALGQEAAAKALNDAKVSVAEKTRDGDIGKAKADQERALGLANSKTATEINEAKADAERRKSIAQSQNEAAQVELENATQLAVLRANKESEQAVNTAEANKLAQIAKATSQAEAERASFEAQKEAAKARAEKEEAELYAKEVVPAEIAKRKAIIEAEATAEQERIAAETQATASFLQAEAEARGQFEKASKQAEAFKQLVEVAGSPEAAVQLLMVDQLPELVAIQVKALTGINFGNITVWDQAGQNGGQGSTNRFISDMLNVTPQYQDLFNLVGAKIPGLLTNGSETVAKVPVTDEEKEILLRG